MSLNQLKLEMMKFQRLMNGNEADAKEILNALLIALLLNTGLKSPMANLSMIDDYMSLCKEYEKEKSVILNYKVANIYNIFYCFLIALFF